MNQQPSLLLIAGCVMALLGCVFLFLGAVPSRHGLIRKQNEPVTFIILVLLMLFGGLTLIALPLLQGGSPGNSVVASWGLTSGFTERQGVALVGLLIGLAVTVVAVVRIVSGGYHGRENWPFGAGSERIWISKQEHPLRFWLSCFLFGMLGLAIVLLSLAVAIGVTL